MSSRRRPGSSGPRVLHVEQPLPGRTRSRIKSRDDDKRSAASFGKLLNSYCIVIILAAYIIKNKEWDLEKSVQNASFG